MKRISWIVVSITAAVMIVAPSTASAASSSGYQSSIAAILGSVGSPGSPAQERDYSSVAAVVGAPSSAGSNDRGERDYTSINALVSGKRHSDRTTSPIEEPGYGSISSIVGPVELLPEREASVVRESSGFDWGDALAGATAALGLILISLATVRGLRRRRRIFAESRT